MTPHEFLKYTPTSNCGDCGYPACLAFAVAVTKGGVTAELCPHIDPSTLPAELSGQQAENGEAGLKNVDRGQEERDMALVEHLKSKVRDLDFASLGLRLGASWSADRPDVLIFSFLGREAKLGRDNVSLDNKSLVDPRDLILLYNYVAFGGGRMPDGNWVGMESLPNSISKIRTLATYCELRLAERFSGRGARIVELCAHLDAEEGPADQSADVGMIISVMPHVPLYLLFWDEEPEDGFSAKVKVLFDHHVMDFLDLESLVFAAERMSDRLAELDI